MPGEISEQNQTEFGLWMYTQARRLFPAIWRKTYVERSGRPAPDVRSGNFDAELCLSLLLYNVPRLRDNGSLSLN